MKADTVAALFIVVLGLFISIMSIFLGVGSLARDEGSSGMFPLAAGIGLVVCGLFQALGSWRYPDLVSWPSFKGALKAVELLGILIVYVILFRGIGYTLATVFFLLFSSLLLGARNWWGILSISIGTALLCWYILGEMLGIPLSGGPFGF
jgi:hypothetical protein